MASSTPPEAPARSPVKLAINITVGIAFSAFFVWLVVRGVDWSRFRAELSTMEPAFLAAYFGLLSVAHWLRLVRWGVTIRALAPVAWPRILAVGAVGMMAIFALPARLGELARPLLISEDPRVNFGSATATVIVERILDGLSMSAILFVTVLLLDANQVPREFLVSGYVAAGVFGSASVGLFLAAISFRWLRSPLDSLLGRFSRPLADKVIGLIGGFFDALRLISAPRVALTYLVMTLAIWSLSGVGIWVLFQAFPGSTGDLPLIAAYTTLSVIVVGIMIPAGPGTVGVFHWAVVFALGMFAVDESAGLLFATTIHLLIALINFVWGVIGGLAGRISVADALKRPPPQAAPHSQGA